MGIEEREAAGSTCTVQYLKGILVLRTVSASCDACREETERNGSNMVLGCDCVCRYAALLQTPHNV